MKKIILILLGMSILLSGVIFILYKNNQSKNEEVIDIFKEKEKVEVKAENKKEEIKKVFVDIKGMITNPGVYEVDSTSRVNEKTTTNMIQKISPIFTVNPLISKEI